MRTFIVLWDHRQRHLKTFYPSTDFSMAGYADTLPFSVANILKVDVKVPKATSRKQGQSSCTAGKALILTERLADVIIDAKNNVDGGNQKRRRTRTAFTQYQLTTLENAFLHTHYPDAVMREQLTIWTRLPESTVQIWFKNRRAKFRKQKRTCFLQVSKEKNADEDANNSVLVSPVCWPSLFPLFTHQGTTPPFTQHIPGEKKLAIPSMS